MNARVSHLEEQAEIDLAQVRTMMVSNRHAKQASPSTLIFSAGLRAKKLKSPAPIVKRADELLAKKFEPARWAVRDLIPEGLTICVGSPKVGKSWLMLQTALAVGNGSPVWKGRRPETAGDVLMLLLEDNDRRVQARIEKLRAAEAHGALSVSRIHYATEWPRMNLDGLAHLDSWLSEHPETRLVIIDTLARFRPPDIGKSSAYLADYGVGAELQAIAIKNRVAIVAIHHTRKLMSSDILDTVSGTQGLTGAVDAAMILRRDRGQFDAALYVTGRDIEHEEDYALRFDEHSCTWSPLGSVHQAQLSRERRDILDFLASHGPSAPGEIAEGLGKKGVAIRRLLQKLLSAGDVKSDGKLYSLIHTYGNSGNNGNSGHDGHAGGTRVTPVTCVTAVTTGTKGTAEIDRCGVLEL